MGIQNPRSNHRLADRGMRDRGVVRADGGWGVRDNTLKAIARQLPFPSDHGETTVEVLYQRGDLAGWICGAHGAINREMIEMIEKDFNDNPGEGFDLGDGIYLFAPHFEDAQCDEFGRVELPAYWDLELVGFRSVNKVMSNTTPTNKATK